MFLCGVNLSTGWIVGLSIAAFILIVAMIVILIMVPFKLWFRALVSSAHISMIKLIGMKLRKVDCQPQPSLYPYAVGNPDWSRSLCPRGQILCDKQDKMATIARLGAARL